MRTLFVRVCLGFLLISSVLLGGCKVEDVKSWFLSSDSETEHILATMGTVSLTADEFQKFLNIGVDADTRQIILENPKQLNRMIRGELVKKYLKNKAFTSGLDKQSDVKYLMERGGAQILIDHYVSSQSKLDGGFPSEEQVRGVYDKNLKRFQIPGRVHLSQLFMALPKTVTEQEQQNIREKMQELVVQIREKGADFASLASKHSQHKVSAKKGGDMGWIMFPNILPEFKEALEGMKVGDVKGPIVTNQGLHLIRVTAWQKASHRPYQQVRNSLIKQLRREQATENQKKYLKELVQKNPVTLQKNNLAQIKKMSP